VCCAGSLLAAQAGLTAVSQLTGLACFAAFEG
jgi:hypothetical protein